MYERYVADLAFESKRSSRNFSSIDIPDAMRPGYPTMSPVKNPNLNRPLPMLMVCLREVVMFVDFLLHLLLRLRISAQSKVGQRREEASS